MALIGVVLAGAGIVVGPLPVLSRGAPPVGPSSDSVGAVWHAAASVVREVSIPVGTYPEALVDDRGLLLVVNGGSDSVTEINASTGGVVRTVPVGTSPKEAIVEPWDGRILVTNAGSPNLTILAADGTATGASLPLGGAAAQVATDARNASLFVVGENGNLSVINGTTGRLVTSAYAVDGVYDDPAAGLVFADGDGPQFNGIVTAWSESRLAPAYSTVVGGTPEAMTSAPGSGDLYVLDPDLGNISVLSTLRGTPIASIAVAGGPWGEGSSQPIAFDGPTGQVFVPDPDTGNVTVVNDATTGVARTIPVGSEPVAVLDVPVRDEVFVANEGSSNVSILSTLTDSVVGSIPVGVFPTALAYDAGSSTLFVADAGSGNITSVPLGPAFYPVEFTESGLPPGLPWAVEVNGSLYSSTGPRLDALAPSGTVAYRISATPGYHRSNGGYAGDLSVGDGAVVVPPFLFSPETYPIPFRAVGLPPSDGWTVILNGTTFVATGTQLLAGPEANGTYNFTVRSGLGSLPEPASGIVVVAGPVAARTIQFNENGSNASVPPSSPARSAGGLAPLELVGVGFVATVAVIAAVAILLRRR